MKNIYIIAGLLLVFSGCEQLATLDISSPGQNHPVLTAQEFSFINYQFSEVKKDLDLLFIIDNSGSMGPHQDTLKSKFNNFVNTNLAPTSGATPIDRFCIGVTTTDAYLNNETVDIHTGQIRFSPYIKGARKFCSHDDSSGQRIPNSLIIQKALNALNTIGLNGSGDERGIESLNAVINLNETSQYKFFRKGTFKSVIMISDEPDSNEFVAGGGQAMPVATVKNNFLDYIRNLDQIPAGQKLDYHMITVIPQKVFTEVNNQRYVNFTNLFGSQSTLRILNTDDFSDILAGLVYKVTESIELNTSTFTLANIPIPGSIKISIQTKTQGVIDVKASDYIIDGAKISIYKDVLTPFLQSDPLSKIIIEYIFYP